MCEYVPTDHIISPEKALIAWNDVEADAENTCVPFIEIVGLAGRADNRGSVQKLWWIEWAMQTKINLGQGQGDPLLSGSLYKKMIQS